MLPDGFTVRWIEEEKQQCPFVFLHIEAMHGFSR